MLAVLACELIQENLLHKPGVVACREDFVHSLQLCDALQPCEGNLSYGGRGLGNSGNMGIL